MTKEETLKSLAQSGYEKITGGLGCLNVVKPVRRRVADSLYQKVTMEVYQKQFDKNHRVLVGDDCYFHEYKSFGYQGSEWRDSDFVVHDVIFYDQPKASRKQIIKEHKKESRGGLFGLFR